jgi:hypothetical protein
MFAKEVESLLGIVAVAVAVETENHLVRFVL